MGNDKSVSMLCIFCEQSFSTNEEMMHHMLFHNVTKSFLCIECNQRYAYKGVLKRHISIHVIEKLFDEQKLTKVSNIPANKREWQEKSETVHGMG